MRGLAVLAICLLLVAPWSAARADDAPSSLPPADQTAIHGVVQSQLNAFRADDAGTAFSYASPGIQGMFGDAGHFLAMVKSAYPMVYRPRVTNFGALVEIDGHPVQKVQLIGADGQAALALYYMEREDDGSWKIAGCQLTESDEVGA